MSFETEIVKVARKRRAFVRFAQEINPGVDWVGPTDRRYGTVSDPYGAVPVSGTVASLGTLSRFVTNPFYDFETPTITTVFAADPNNEWRQLAAPPSNQLQFRWVDYWLRVHDDTDTIVDQVLSRGQITAIDFPDNGCSLQVQLTPGDWLGQQVSRRRISLADWPRALPSVVGEMVPYILGSVRNSVPALVGGLSPSGDPNVADGCCFDVAGLIWSDNFNNYGSYIPVGSIYSDMTMNYPHMDGGGVNGTTIPSLGALDVVNGTVSGRGIASTPGWYAPPNQPGAEVAWDTHLEKDVGAQYQPTGCVGFSVKAPTLLGDEMASRLVTINADADPQPEINTGGPMLSLIQNSGIVEVNDAGRNLDVFLIADNDEFSPPTLIGSGARYGIYGWTCDALQNVLTPGTFQKVEVKWRCSTILNATLMFSSAELTGGWARDGWVEVRIDGVVAMRIEDCFVVGGEAGNNAEAQSIDYETHGHWHVVDLSTIGGVIDCFYITDGEYCDIASADTPADCGVEGAGAGPKAGGAVRCLLVDSGQTTGGGCSEDMAVVGGLAAAKIAVTSPAAPTGLAAALATGVTVCSGFTRYYAITAVVAGVESEISNVVSITTSSTQQLVNLTWTAHPTPGAKIRVYRSFGGGAAFLQYDRYNYSDLGPGRPTDLPAGTTSLTDYVPCKNGTLTLVNAGITANTHWDLQYRRHYYYYVSAKVQTENGTCETPMAGPVGVTFAPKQSFNTVRVTWSAYSPPTGSTLVGYVIRREGQEYSFPKGWNGQFEVGVTTTYDDPITQPLNRTPVTFPTNVEAQEREVTYLVAGHTCKRVREVYVLKPVARLDGSLSEARQVLQVEGADYRQEVVEINGNRYHCLIFARPQQSDQCQQYEVSCNVDGVETNADATGTLLEDAAQCFEWVLLNVILNTYRSSIGDYAPPGNKYFTDVPYAPGLVDATSFGAASTAASGVITGGYIAAGVATQSQYARELIGDWVRSFGWDFYQHGGQWKLRLPNPGTVSRAGVTTSFDPSDDVFQGTFKTSLDVSLLANVIPYFAGPLGGVTESLGYLYSSEYTSAGGLGAYGGQRMEGQPLYLPWTRDQATAISVVSRYAELVQYPLVRATFTSPIGHLVYEPASEVLITHPKAVASGTAGAVNQVYRLLKADPNLDDLTMNMTAICIDHLVP